MGGGEANPRGLGRPAQWHVLAGRTVFAQLMSHIAPRKFRTCVDRYGGDYNAVRFSCWDQFLCMAFAQSTYRESLRAIEACLRAVQPKLYHLCIRSRVARSTLPDANEPAIGASMRTWLRA